MSVGLSYARAKADRRNRTNGEARGASARSAYDRITGALRDTCSVRYTRDGHARAKCPAHNSQSDNSLAVTRIEGQALIYCFGGCDAQAVLTALGMRMRDLYDDPSGITYQYDDGRQVHRSPAKNFRQIGNTKGKAQLYRLSAVAQAVSSDITVAVVEGEKDVHALE